MSNLRSNEVQRFGKAGDQATNIDGAVRASSESFSQDIDGICTSTYVCTGDYYKLIEHAHKLKEHPSMKDLVRTNYGVQRLDGTLGRATLTFKGVEKGKSYMRYTLDSGTDARPIETHPFFVRGKTIPDGEPNITENDAYGYRFGDRVEGGIPDGSKQAFYDETQLAPSFKHFPINAYYDLPGVTQFLGMGMTLNLIYISYADDNFRTKIDSNIDDGGYAFHVGMVCDPPDEIKPDIDSVIKEAGGISSRYNWMVTRCNVEIVGSAMRQEVQFTLSGYRGWNKLIYNSEDPQGSVNDKRYETSNITDE